MKAKKSNNGAQATAQPQKKSIVHYVPYWQGPDGAAFEAIHVRTSSGNVPMFLCWKGDKPQTCPEIAMFIDEKTDEFVRPVDDFPYEPYLFTRKEIDALPSKLPKDESERAYQTILDTIRPYQDTEEWHLQIDAAGILLSYLQDKVESVPYIAKVGAAESGKTRSLGLISSLAYRPMMAVDVTSANVYRYYGRDIQAAGTIIHDEVDDGEIDKDASLRSIYNSGYRNGARVPRIGGENNDKQSYYFCYGIKWFGGTELPYSRTFRSRCIIQHFMQGIPEKIDITDKDKELFRNVRKGLLVMRLLKSSERFEQVNTGLTGRSRELYTPLLAPLQGTKWYDTLLSPLQQLDRERHAEDRESKQAYISQAVIGCWLAAAQEKLNVQESIKPESKELDSVKEPIFLSNDSVIANLALTEITNEKGRKILVSDDLPFTLSRWEIGRIQSENLKGKSTTERFDKKVLRGHEFTLQTIRSLHRRYFVTLDDKCNACNTSVQGVDPIKDLKSPSDHAQNEPLKGPTPTVTSVTSVTSVTDLIQCPKAKCSLKFKTPELVINHSIRSHKGFPVTAELQARGYKVD